MKTIDKTGNQINTIYPYRTKGGWAFDDEEVGLQMEPFICNIPQIIDSIVGKKKDSFTCHISHSKIPGSTGQLIACDPPKEAATLEREDGWYQLKGTKMIGWLCPATLRYFKKYPPSIYFKIE